MKILGAAVVLTMALSSTVQARVEVIYGQDNRKDVYQVTNALHKNLSNSTAGMVRITKLAQSSTRGFFDIIGAPTLERSQNICASEAFSQQPIAPTCSGFLIAPDLLVTAGHCYKARSTPEEACKSFVWIFDYNMQSETTDPTKSISVKNIYLCKEVLSSELTPLLDFSIIKLDRPVIGREPLKFRTSGKISNSASLVVIGHPSALPTKISDGGKVTFNKEANRFNTTLDTFHGNSGSAVFDAETGVLEGILIMGKSDYQFSKPEDTKSCMVVNKCDDKGGNCTAGTEVGAVVKGEVVLRISAFQEQLQKALAPN